MGFGDRIGNLAERLILAISREARGLPDPLQGFGLERPYRPWSIGGRGGGAAGQSLLDPGHDSTDAILIRVGHRAPDVVVQENSRQKAFAER